MTYSDYALPRLIALELIYLRIRRLPPLIIGQAHEPVFGVIHALGWIGGKRLSDNKRNP